MPSPDSELITLVLLRDDRRAFAELVRRHQASVRGMLRQVTCGDLALADELAQETFILCYRKLGQYRGDGGLRGWLMRIALNQFRSFVRKRGAPVVDPDLDAQRSSSTLLRHDLRRALAELSEDERIAIALCHAAGFTHEEAAALLQIPLGTLKSHVTRGTAKLRKRLAAWKETEVA